MKKFFDFVLEKKDEIIKLIDFPHLRQSNIYTCGVVAVQTILVYYGIDMREEDLEKKLKTVKSDKEVGGTYLKNIKKVFNEYGLKVDEKEKMTIDEVKEYIDKDIPVMLLIQAYGDEDSDKYYSEEWGEGHNVIAIGYTKNKILFSNSSEYTTSFLSNNSLLKRWHDKEGKKEYKQFGLAVYGKKPKYDSEKLSKII